MNKKGFTLVELLAVIVLLGLVTTIVATKGFGAFDNTKKKINEQNVKAIEEAAKVLMAEVENCDDDLKEYEDLRKYFESTKNNISINSCANLKKEIKETQISLDDLQKGDYISGNDVENISGTIFVKFDMDANKGTVKEFIQTNEDNADKPKIYNFVSNNQKKNSTEAKTILTFTPLENGNITFDWSVSSETNWDKLTIKLNSEILVNGVSGTKNGKIDKPLIKDTVYTLIMSYTKDGSVYKGDDQAKIENLKITSKLKNELKVENFSNYFTQIIQDGE